MVSRELVTDPRTIAPIAMDGAWPIFVAVFSGLLFRGAAVGSPERRWLRRERRPKYPKRVAIIAAAGGSASLAAVAATACAAGGSALG